MNRTLCLLVVSLFFLLAPLPALAQVGSGDQRSAALTDHGLFFGLGGGTGLSWTTVGGHTRSGFSLGITLQGGLWRNGERRWVVEGTLHPTATENPVRAEEFRALDLLVRYSVGSRLFLAPGLGLQTRRWSGDNPAEDWDIGPVASLAAGTYLDTESGWILAPELFVDVSLIELEGDVTTGRAGLRLSFVRVDRSGGSRRPSRNAANTPLAR